MKSAMLHTVYCFSFARIATKKDAMDPANNTTIISAATGASLIYTQRLYVS